MLNILYRMNSLHCWITDKARLVHTVSNHLQAVQ